MGRIINFVSASGGTGKSSLLYIFAKLLAEGGKKICVFDGYFGLNSFSLINHKGVDLKEYLCGNANLFDVVNKVETNLYFIKTDSINFDYNKHIEHVNLILEEIAFEFDYVLIDSCVFNDLAFSGLLEISNEIIMVLTDDNIVIKNSAKLISKIKSKSKNVQVKILLNKARIIHQIKGEALDEITISKLLKEEIIFVLPKFLKYNQIKIQKMVNFKNKILSRYCYSIITNKQDILNYQKKYLGPIGWLRRKLYEKFEQ